METETYAEMTDERTLERKTGLKEPVRDRQNGFVVPAGILIGLGAGLLAGYAGAGFLIGLGLGLIGAELVPLLRTLPGNENLHPGSTNVLLLLAGAVLVLAGAGIAGAPAEIWMYALPGLMILAGAGILVRGFRETILK